MVYTGGTTGSTRKGQHTYRKGNGKSKDKPQSIKLPDIETPENTNMSKSDTSIQYSQKKYEDQHEAYFGYGGNYTSENKALLYANDKISFSEIADLGVKPVGITEALKFFDENMYMYVKLASELEGYSTNEAEVLELATDGLEEAMLSENTRISTVAGLVELHKKITSNVQNGTGVDARMWCDYNSSTGFADVRLLAGSIRGTTFPGIACSIPLPKRRFIPPMPQYGGENLVQKMHDELIIADNLPILQRAVYLESSGAYNQFFQDGNKRASAGLMNTILLQNGYIPPAVDGGTWFRDTQYELLITGDATSRMNAWLEIIQTANTKWYEDGGLFVG